jgi:Family of unknown function (DUF5694)
MRRTAARDSPSGPKPATKVDLKTGRTPLRYAASSLAVWLAIMGTPSAAQTPAVDPTRFKAHIAGSPSDVLVLGTLHLGQVAGEPIKPDYLEPLLARLAAYKPDIITIEGMSGQSCDILGRYAASYPGVAAQYCRDTKAAEAATGLTVPAAEAEMIALLNAWPAAATPVQRRHLASVFLAANDRPSALVQWLRLPAIERHAGDGLDAALVTLLGELMIKPSENYQIAAVLAARLGHERVYGIDDHTADSIIAPLGKDFDAALKAVWDMPDPADATDTAKEAAAKSSGAGVLDYYRYLNAPKTLAHAMDTDFVAAMQQQTPALYGRQYVAWWEARNLRMVANIRVAFGNRPGARVLSIVGSSHKPYFDAYLNLLHDVRLVDAETVLK